MQTKVIIKGYITNIIREDKFVKITVATNIFNKNQQTGEINKRGTIWNNFILFEKCDLLKIGMFVLIEAHMTLRKDGERSNEYVADNIYLDIVSEEKRLKK